MLFLSSPVHMLHYFGCVPLFPEMILTKLTLDQTLASLFNLEVNCSDVMVQMGTLGPHSQLPQTAPLCISGDLTSAWGTDWSSTSGDLTLASGTDLLTTSGDFLTLALGTAQKQQELCKMENRI